MSDELEYFLTDEQLDVIEEYLEDKGLEMGCPACGEDEVTVGTQALRMSGVDLESGEASNDEAPAYVELVCTDCGYARFFRADAIEGLYRTL